MQQSNSTPPRPKLRGYRVLVNLLRMFAGLLLGLWLVRLLLSFGADAAAAILLLGSGIGLCAITQQLLEMSLTPVLGLAYQSKDRQKIDIAYSSAFLVSLVVGTVAMVLFILLAVLLHKMEVPEELLWGARWFVVAKAVQTVVVVILAPHTTMYLVQSRMTTYNLNLLSERVGEVVSALAILAMGVSDPAMCIAAFGIISAALRCSYLLVSSYVCDGASRISFASLRSVTSEEIHSTLAAVRENVIIVIANTSYLRLDQICVNLAGGLQANLVFSIASQLVAYIRLLTHGQAIGLESASAQIYTQNQNSPSSLNSLIRVSSRHQAILVLPASCLLGFLAEPIVQVWLGTRMGEIGYSTKVLVDVLRLLLLGITLRALTEGWMRIFNGTGHVKFYARPSLWGASINALIAPTVILISPPELVVYIAAGMFAALHIAVHVIWIPLALCRLTQSNLRQLAEPLVRPFLVAAACLPCLLVGRAFANWNIVSLSVVTLFYLASYGIGTLFVSLNKPERTALWGTLSQFRRREQVTQVNETIPRAA